MDFQGFCWIFEHSDKFSRISSDFDGFLNIPLDFKGVFDGFSRIYQGVRGFQWIFTNSGEFPRIFEDSGGFSRISVDFRSFCLIFEDFRGLQRF